MNLEPGSLKQLFLCQYLKNLLFIEIFIVYQKMSNKKLAPNAVYQILMIILFTQTLTAQKYMQGYVIENGAKKDGIISYSPSKKENNALLFKSGKTEPSRKLTADEVDGFFLTFYDAHFVSVTEKVSGKSIFAEVTIKGPVTLSTSGSLHILSKENGTLQFHLPIGKNVYSSKDEVADKKLLEVRTVGAIKDFLSVCWDPNTDDLSDFSISKLTAIVKKYNQCRGVITNAKRGKIRPGIVLGVNTTMLTLKNSTRTFQIQPGFTFGASLDLPTTKFHDKSIFNLQVIYLNNSIKEVSENGLELTRKTLRFPVSLKRFLQPGQRGFCINPGVSPSFLMEFSAKNNLLFPRIDSNQNFTGSAFLGIGWETFITSSHKLSANVRYEQELISPYNYESTQRYLHFQVTYSF
jgi:hypothetical protein